MALGQAALKDAARQLAPVACGPSLTAAPPNAGDIAGRNQKTALQPNQKTGREKKLEEITLERD